MDSANGNIIWSRNLGLTVQANPELAIHGMWLVRELGETGSPMLAVLAARTKNEVFEFELSLQSKLIFFPGHSHSGLPCRCLDGGDIGRARHRDWPPIRYRGLYWHSFESISPAFRKLLHKESCTGCGRSDLCRASLAGFGYLILTSAAAYLPNLQESRIRPYRHFVQDVLYHRGSHII